MRGYGIGERFFFGGVWPRVCGQLLGLDRPTCYPCPALPGAAHIMLLFEHGRGKRAHPIYRTSVGPRAMPGARRLPKRFVFENCVIESWPSTVKNGLEG